MPVCKIRGCKRPVVALGMCNTDYKRFKRRGSTDRNPLGRGNFASAGTVGVHQRGHIRIAYDLIPKRLVGKTFSVELEPDIKEKKLQLRFVDDSGSLAKRDCFYMGKTKTSPWVAAQAALRILKVPWPEKGETFGQYKATLEKDRQGEFILVDFKSHA